MTEISGISRFTLMAALQEGRLHGGQAIKRGTWRSREDCFDAFLVGDECPHRAVPVAA
ncbi:MAG: hypothetical protein ACTH32_06295 [Microbacterium gubbeenense]|uniref:hypothetical protein n=1 Tax=Microbacterium gubbeenense TaxID=159896 RepID=UPI003F9CA3EF